jgi:hypothetical protein
MTAPTASTKPKIALDQRAPSRHDGAVLTLQQREGQSFSAVLGGGAILHQGLASAVSSFSSSRTSLWARIDRGKVQSLTRYGLDWTAKYRATAAALANEPLVPVADLLAGRDLASKKPLLAGPETSGLGYLITTIGLYG